MGVCGCGKSVVGAALAEQLAGVYEDGDDFHSPQAKAKMASGTPLDDEDRRPWYARMRDRILEMREHTGLYILACSALRERYRDWLRAGEGPELIQFVHLAGSQELIQQRMDARKGHFMSPTLVASQFATLESPVGAIEVSVDQPIESVVAEVLQRLRA
jgi:gluconokinase